ncbi:MAG: hypothetical protein IKF11_08725, partial [Methanobrevibacter sp.]|nr:hypothetical protein [Methanobrevibacter sp.]
IAGTQGKRYDAIMDLCGIKDINKIESAFSSSTSSLKKELSSTESNYDDILEDLSYLLYGDRYSGYDECIGKLNSILKENGKEGIDEDTNIDNFVDNLDMSRFTQIKNKIDEYQEHLGSIDFLTLNSNLDNIIAEYQSLASNNLKSSQYLLNTLNESVSYLELTNTDTCPVCNNSIDSSKTIMDIKERISEISQSNSKFNDWKNDLNQLISKVDTQIRHCERLEEIYNDFVKLTDVSKINLNYDGLINLKNDLEDFLELKKVATDFDSINFNLITDDFESIGKQLHKYEKDQNIDELSNIYNALFKVKELNELNIAIKNLTKQYTAAKMAFEIFKDTKQEYIIDMMDEIKDDVKFFYEYIHSDDAINSPDIVLTDSKKIDVYLDSFGDVVDSRSYASEGHLDTLGICIFLAFNKKFNELPLIVLDDVFTTVDVYHKDKIADLIINELSDYQFFITTHNVPWANQLKNMCQKANKDYLLYEITDWSFENGPIIEKKDDDDFIHEKERKNTIRNISDKLKEDMASIDDIFSDMDKLS